MNVGDTVTLVPTEGGYQKEQTAIVQKVSPKRVTVRIQGRVGAITFNRDTGKGASRLDREFPNYRLKQ